MLCRYVLCRYVLCRYVLCRYAQSSNSQKAFNYAKFYNDILVDVFIWRKAFLCHWKFLPCFGRLIFEPTVFRGYCSQVSAVLPLDAHML